MGKDRVRIFDTTLRDGEQAPGFSLRPAEKLLLARQLDSLGVDIIEAGFPIASPADADAVRLIATELRRPVIACLARCHRADLEKAAESIKPAAQGRIHTFIATSDLHLSAKLRITREQCLEAAVDAVRYARHHTYDVEFSAEDATRSDFDFLCRVIEAVIKVGASTVNLPDTVGYGTPDETLDFFQRVRERIPNSDKVIFSTHCHAADEPRRLRRDPDRAHRLQLQGRAAEEQGRADRLVHDSPGDRARERRGRGDEAEKPQRGAAVLRVRGERRGPARSVRARFRADQPQDRDQPQQGAAAIRRPEGRARRVPEMGKALRRHFHQAGQIGFTMGKESHYSSKKDRMFVRGIHGQYSLKEELARLRSMPRVIKGRELTFNDGPQSFSKHFIEPVDGLTQTLHIHLEEYGPGGRTQKHGHVNEAAF